MTQIIITNWILSLNLYCSETIIENHTNIWNNIDKQAYHTAETGCERSFGPEWGCMRKFIKMEENTYRVICGEKADID